MSVELDPLGHVIEIPELIETGLVSKLSSFSDSGIQKPKTRGLLFAIYTKCSLIVLS